MKRYRITESGYKIDKIIFIISMLVIFTFLGYLMYLQDFNFTPKFYIKCNNHLGCTNPFYGESEHKQELKILFFIPLYKTKDARNNCIYDWCNKKIIPAGEYGTPQPTIFKLLWYIIISIFGLSFLYNHIIHNKGKKLDLGLKAYWRRELKKLGINTDKIKIKLEDDED